MLVDRDDRAPNDLTRVSLAEEWETRWWCNKYGVTEPELRACVLEVGPVAADVERRLTKAARTGFKNMGED